MMAEAPEGLTEFQRRLWCRTARVVKELASRGQLFSANISAPTWGKTLVGVSLRKQADGYIWSAPLVNETHEETNFYVLWLELAVWSLAWDDLVQLIIPELPFAQLHLPQMLVEQRICKAPARDVLEIALIYPTQVPA